MTSPLVRRNRLATELRTLREQRGMTAEALSRQIFRSRMAISKLENTRSRPQIADVLNVEDGEWRRILGLARDAAERGWWDAYGDAMGCTPTSSPARQHPWLQPANVDSRPQAIIDPDLA